MDPPTRGQAIQTHHMSNQSVFSSFFGAFCLPSGLHSPVVCRLGCYYLLAAAIQHVGMMRTERIVFTEYVVCTKRVRSGLYAKWFVFVGMCMGGASHHVVRFDGMALRLDEEGLCSYTLLAVARGNGTGTGSEVKLHSGPCQGSANHDPICMRAMEVSHGASTLLLKDDMTVICACDCVCVCVSVGVYVPKHVCTCFLLFVAYKGCFIV